MTAWEKLNDDIFDWLERDLQTDQELLAARPRIIELAQKRCLRDLKLTAFNDEKDRTVGINDRFFARPELMTAMGTVLLNVNGVWKPLQQVTRDFIAEWQSTVTETGQPRYVAIWDDDNLVVAPIPDKAYSIKVQCRREVELLSESKVDNELSFVAYDLLLAASLAYACVFSQDTRSNEIQPKYETLYADLLRSHIGAEADVVTGAYRQQEPTSNNS